MCTGDRFVRDEDGFYFFRGRKDDLIKISGQWVNPIEVQRCLAEHPWVCECAVLPIELRDKRMSLKAFVVMNGVAFDAKSAARALQDHVKQRLVPYKYPRFVQFMPALPKTGTGRSTGKRFSTRLPPRGMLRRRLANDCGRRFQDRIAGGRFANKAVGHESAVQRPALGRIRADTADGSVH